MLLGSIGLFGAVAHWASGRTREIGIRMALGATRGDVAWMVLRQSLSVMSRIPGDAFQIIGKCRGFGPRGKASSTSARS